MTTTHNWQRFINAHRGTDDGATIARRTGASPASVSRWVNGTGLPRPQQATAFAKSYRANPLTALIASGYITAEDIDLDAVAAGATPDLSQVNTTQLLSELQTRLEDLQEAFSITGSDATDADRAAVLSALVSRHLPTTNVSGYPQTDDEITDLTAEELATTQENYRLAALDLADPEAEQEAPTTP